MNGNTGTINEIEDAGGLYLNDRRLTRLEINTLANMGILPMIGKQKSASGRGKPANVLSVPTGKVEIDLRLGS